MPNIGEKNILIKGAITMRFLKKIHTIIGVTLIIMLFNLLSACKLNKASSTFRSSSVTNSIVDKTCTIDYLSIIQEYQIFAEYLINDDIESVLDNNIFNSPDEDLSYNWGNMLVETNIWYYRNFAKDRDAFGYALKDLNNDGNDELILLLKDYTVLAIFSIFDDYPKLIDAYWPKHRCAIYDSGVIYTLSSSGAASWYYTMQEITSDSIELMTLEEFGMHENNYYKVIDGEKNIISKSEFDEINEKYPHLSDTVANEITKNSGIEFIPLFK